MVTKFIAALALIFSALTCVAAYPERPIRLVVPAAPGGAVDAVGRITGQKISERVGQNVVIDNRTGANQIIGTEIVARAAPDGYTLLITAGAFTINPSLYRKLPYDALRDFAPVVHIANSGGLVIVVHPSFPPRSISSQSAVLPRISPASSRKISGSTRRSSRRSGFSRSRPTSSGAALLAAPCRPIF